MNNFLYTGIYAFIKVGIGLILLIHPGRMNFDPTVVIFVSAAVFKLGPLTHTIL
jgi:hypothetical protein